MENVVKGKNKLFIALGVVVMASLIFISFAFSKQEAVATVGGNTIEKEELYNILVGQYGDAALETLIAEKIVDLEAKEQKIKVENSEIQAEVDVLIEEYGGEEELQAALEQSGTTLEGVKENITSYLLTEKLLESRIEITDEEISEYFETNKDYYNQPEQVKANHILVEDAETANEVKQKLNEGADFSELAKEYSIDTSNAESGGDLGYFARGEMVTAFEDVSFAMEIDEVSDPVETEYGFHIIQVVDKKAAQEAVLEDNTEEIRETLFNQDLQTEYATWLEEQKEKYEIKTFLQ